MNIETNQGVFKSKYLIACAGLQSDRITKKENPNVNVKIVPFRGEYYSRAGAGEIIRSLDKSAFVKKAPEYFPRLRNQDLIASLCGIRAQALSRNGRRLLNDFYIISGRKGVAFMFVMRLRQQLLLLFTLDDKQSGKQKSYFVTL